MPAKAATMRPVVETPSEVIVNQASAIKYRKDARGRNIGAVKPSALIRIRLFKIIGAENSMNQRLVNELMLPMCVREIEGEQIIINTEMQLDNLVARLDDDGLSAVAQIFIEDFALGVGANEDGKD